MPKQSTCVKCGKVANIPDEWKFPVYKCPKCGTSNAVDAPLELEDEVPAAGGAAARNAARVGDAIATSAGNVLALLLIALSVIVGFMFVMSAFASPMTHGATLTGAGCFALLFARIIQAEHHARR